MQNILSSWLAWSLLSALFAALTAILAKVGIAGISSDVATLIRTLVIAAMTAVLVAATGQWPTSSALGARSVLFLILSGLATGASWLCYFRALKLGDAARVAPIDKLSVVLVAIMGVLLLGEQLAPRHVAGIALIALGAVLVAT